MAQEIIGVIARMDWDNTLNLLPAMGRSPEDTKVVQDLESPGQLGAGFLQQVVNIVVIHGAAELFIIGSSYSETAQDVLDRVSSLRESGQLPANLPIHGLLYNPASYRLELVYSGY
ncbi:hypothetical protein TEPIDINF_002671 [Tepidibacillus infernus]|uniref:hypothetical protein n=1 Tax=Tepidibacillus infernus TaxID=1806172 RepID=UPI003B6C919B